MSLRVFFDWLVGKRRKQLVPNKIQLTPHIPCVCGNRNYCIMFRKHNAELAVFPVSAKSSVSAAPELKTVALLPIIE